MKEEIRVKRAVTLPKTVPRISSFILESAPRE